MAFVYEGSKTGEISFPMGGIGSGCIGLAGDGRLVDWEIFNRPNKGSANGYTHFAVKAERDGEVLDARVLQGDLLPPYTGSLKAGAGSTPFGSGPPRSFLSAAPHFRTASFRGEFPVATLTLNDDAFPGAVAVTAFNPFIPLNEDDSSIPAAFFEVEIHNPQDAALTYTVCLSVNNPVPGAAKVNRFQRIDGLSMIGMRARGAGADGPAAGDMTVATDAPDVSCQEYWRRAAYKGIWVDDVTAYWRDLSAPGRLANRDYEEEIHARGASLRSAHCLLAAHLQVDAHSTGRARFVLAWNFPVYTNYWNPAPSDPGSDPANGSPAGNSWRNYYATLWKDSQEAAHYALSNWDRLYRETVSFKEALFSSTLPAAVVDAVSANLSVLKSPTMLRLQDGTLYGFEGCHPDEICCEGSCTHVWNYAYALPFLFPRLERGMRDADYRYNLRDDGGMSFRLQLPLGCGRSPFRPCADGQFGGIVKVYRDWKISGDSDWLARLWPAVKKSMAFAWSPDNRDRWDRDRDGVLEGRQHHTLDTELFGPNSWLTGFYLAALKAAAEMAEHLEDADAAAEYRSLFHSGKRWVDAHLFNGEYYHQLIDLANKDILEELIDNDATVVDAGTGRTAARRDWDEYWDAAGGQINYQVAEGCGIDQVVAQWHANIAGLGEIFDPQQRRTALRSVFRYNFVRQMRHTFNPRRVFSLNDESGMLTCSYPRGRPNSVIPFAEETMSGFEYQAAGHMIQEGLVDEGIAVVEAIRARYDGEKRNPWNEMECGSNYARAMSSYALLPVLSGFEFDMTTGEIGFHPMQDRPAHRFFWCLQSAWGTVQLNVDRMVLSVHFGSIALQRFNAGPLLEPGAIAATLDGRALPNTRRQQSVILAEPARLEAGSVLRLELRP